MEKDKNIKNVYLLNQDYQFGHQVAKAAKEMLSRRRPDVKIVGEELHPLAKVKDFSPYIAKIKNSGADSVITGNWGSDLVLLIKAAKEAGLNTNFFTYYAGVIGGPTAIGEAGADRVYMVSYGSPNIADPKTQQFLVEYEKKHPKEDFYVYAARAALEMLAKAMTQAKTTEPKEVAKAMEGMRLDGMMGELQMRAQDHQILTPLFIDVFTKAQPAGLKFDAEDTGLGFKNVAKIDAQTAAQPTSCQMKRPS